MKRIEFLDITKAWAIFLIVVGHCSIDDMGLLKWIGWCTFYHVPLFYIISGFLWDKEKYKNMHFLDFLKRKFKAYIIPYFKISAVCFLVASIAIVPIKVGWFTDDYWLSLAKYLFGIFIYMRGTTEWLPGCSPIWFLPALFFAELMYYFINKNRYGGGYICRRLNMRMPFNFTYPVLYR